MATIDVPDWVFRALPESDELALIGRRVGPGYIVQVDDDGVYVKYPLAHVMQLLQHGAPGMDEGRGPEGG